MSNEQNADDGNALSAIAGGVKTLIKGNGLSNPNAGKYSTLDMKKKDEEIEKLRKQKKEDGKKINELNQTISAKNGELDKQKEVVRAGKQQIDKIQQEKQSMQDIINQLRNENEILRKKNAA